MPKRPPTLRLRPPRPAAERHRHHDRTRGTAAERGYDAHHRRWREAVLQRDPLCKLCEARGRITPSTVADHITPIVIDPSRRLDVSNGRGLCAGCHAQVTANFRQTSINELPTSTMEKAVLVQPMERRGPTSTITNPNPEDNE